MKIKTKYLSFFSKLSIIIFIIIFSCKKDSTNISTSTKFDNGVFIVNEGQYGKISGTISFFSKSENRILNQDIFKEVNNFPLGDVVQSMYLFNNNGYIVVNNSNKLEIVSIADFKSIATINGLLKPRYFLPINNNIGYVSQWGADGKTGSIKIIDLNKNLITDSIILSSAPEQLILSNNQIYIACSGGYSNSDKVIVIDALTNKIKTEIIVGDIPTFIKSDKNSNIWVLCKGKYKADFSGLETAGKLIKINSVTNKVDLNLDFPLTEQPSNLELNNNLDKLYYNFASKIYTLDINSIKLNISTPLISKNFYGISVDKATDNIYCGYSPNFTNNGFVYRYKNNGTIIDSFISGGIGTHEFIFK